MRTLPPFIGLIRPVCVAAACLAVALVPGGCSRQNGNDVTSRVLLVGVDGLEWDVVLPMLADGRLPAMASLMERGRFGRLRSFQPTESPVLWTSIATGKTPAEHGITGFVYTGLDQRPRLFNSTFRRSKALWNILSDYGKRVHCIGWWMTYPAEKINGVMVGQTNTISGREAEKTGGMWKGALVKGVPGQVHPEGRQDEMVAILEGVEGNLDDLLIGVFGRFATPLSALGERLWDNCRWAFRADATYHRIAAGLAREQPPFDLMMVYFGGPDVVGHRFWRYMLPEKYDYQPSAEQVANLGPVITTYYAYVDRIIGELIDLSPADTTVLIVSDHGMRAVNRSVKFDADQPLGEITSGHHKDAPPGVFIAAGPGIGGSATDRPPAQLTLDDLPVVGSVLDVAPTVLALQSIPVGKDMDGRVMGNLLGPRFDRSRLPAPVDTHDTPEFLARKPTAISTDPKSDAQRIQQLRSLGYLGGGP